MIDHDDNRFAVSKSIEALQMITHRFSLDKLLCAYDTFDKLLTPRH